MKKLALLLFLMGAFLSPSLFAQTSITTLYGSNNGGAPGGGVYFDLTVGPNPISITAIDLNTGNNGNAVSADIYVLTGTGSGLGLGNENNGPAWVLSATGTGTGAGEDNPTALTLNNPINLAANTGYGIAIDLDANSDHDYTDGNGSNQSYTNSDLTLQLGSASNKGVPSGGSLFSPRVWNGTIYYSVGGAPTNIPTLSEWGLIVFSLMLLIFGTIYIRRRVVVKVEG